jgi:predicted TIM-barrel enzyme
MDWIFDGIGTAIITLILGLLTGGTIGYRIGIKKTNKVNQNQKAKDNASQIQVGRDYNDK